MSGIFHLALPANNLRDSVNFYVSLGAKSGRYSPQYHILDFFGGQVVLHLSSEVQDPAPKMYPKHFGFAFDKRSDYDKVYQNAMSKGLIPYFKPFVRAEGSSHEHRTFFLKDPSHNLVEFKWYRDKAGRF